MKVQLVDIDKVKINSWNPNRFNDEKFRMLVEEVVKEGIDQPIIVINDKQNGGYIIVDGEHRYLAAKERGDKKIPVVVKDWDEYQAKVETIRRNVLRGEIDKARFVDLVNSVVAEYNVSMDQVMADMALTEEEFNQLYQEKEANLAILEEVRKSKDEALYEDVSYIVNKIMAENKDNIDKGYVYFMYKGATILVLELDKNDKVKLIDFISRTEERGKNLMKECVRRILKEKDEV